MFYLDYNFSLYMYMLSCFIFSFNFKHLVLMVISLEFIMLSVLLNIYIILINSIFLIDVLLYFLVFSVCESCLALSLIIMIVRLFGNDYINSLSILKW